MSLTNHFQMLARYNLVANERLFSSCAQLGDVEYRKRRAGSFGSSHALLNHCLVGDRIWMERFEGGGTATPPLHSILCSDFAALRKARVEQDGRIERFFLASLPDDFWSRTFRYFNHQQREYVEEAPVAVAHFFNHQTHHRGQVHVMLHDAGLEPPSLDLHRIMNP